MKIKRARIKYTYSEIFFAVLAFALLIAACGCLRLFMGGPVPHTGRAMLPKDGGR